MLVERAAFHPHKVPADTPPVQAPGVEEVRVTAADGVRLQAFYFTQPDATRALLFLHGNAGNAYHRLDDARALAAQGVNVLLLSYRGYGRSAGRPTERGVYADGAAALQWLIDDKNFAARDTFILGRSIGSAVAVHIAQDRRLGGLALVTPMSSGRDIARAHGLGLFTLFTRPFDSISKVPNLKSPVLVIHGDRDEIIPLWCGRKLYDACAEPKQMRVVPGAMHNDLIEVAGDAYYRWIGDFIREPTARAP